MPELELGLAVGAWSMDTETGDERGSGNPTAAAAAPTAGGTTASPSEASAATDGRALPGTCWEAPAANTTQQMRRLSSGQLKKGRTTSGRRASKCPTLRCADHVPEMILLQRCCHRLAASAPLSNEPLRHVTRLSPRLSCRPAPVASLASSSCTTSRCAMPLSARSVPGSAKGTAQAA